MEQIPLQGLRIRSLCCLIAASACLLLGGCRDVKPETPFKNPDAETVESYCGRKLADLNSDELRPLNDALARLCPGRGRIKVGVVLRPAYVWKFSQGREPVGCLVLESGSTDLIPGTTDMRLTVVDNGGRIRSESEFTTGWRSSLKEARLMPVVGVEFPVLALRAPPVRGNDQTGQFFTLIDDRFDLIRLEDKSGATIRNYYWGNRSGCGQDPPAQSDEQWEADLRTGDRARVLRALVWLGGTHDLSKVAAGPGLQASVLKVRARPGVAKRLSELAEAGNKWEREAAALALRPNDQRQP
jgi:hypothetical protein